MVCGHCTRDAVAMNRSSVTAFPVTLDRLTGTLTRPGAFTRGSYERLHDERVHHELAMLSMRAADTHDDTLQRRIALLHMWLAQPHR